MMAEPEMFEYFSLKIYFPLVLTFAETQFESVFSF